MFLSAPLYIKPREIKMWLCLQGKWFRKRPKAIPASEAYAWELFLQKCTRNCHRMTECKKVLILQPGAVCMEEAWMSACQLGSSLANWANGRTHFWDGRWHSDISNCYSIRSQINMNNWLCKRHSVSQRHLPERGVYQVLRKYCDPLIPPLCSDPQDTLEG